MTAKEHLQFIHDRIISEYGESENVDFLIKLREIIYNHFQDAQVDPDVERITVHRRQQGIYLEKNIMEENWKSHEIVMVKSKRSHYPCITKRDKGLEVVKKLQAPLPTNYYDLYVLSEDIIGQEHYFHCDGEIYLANIETVRLANNNPNAKKIVATSADKMGDVPKLSADFLEDYIKNPIKKVKQKACIETQFYFGDTAWFVENNSIKSGKVVGITGTYREDEELHVVREPIFLIIEIPSDILIGISNVISEHCFKSREALVNYLLDAEKQ